MTERRAILERLGLHRRELRAWALYDVANSAFYTTVIAAVFPIYFAKVAASDLPPSVATTRFAWATTIALAVIAVISPVLGAVADYTASKKKMLGVFLALGVTATAGMVLIGQGDWLLGATLFVLGNIGIAGTFVFYDSLLPHVARPDEIDRVSSAGYALGYLGGGILLALNLAWIEKPEWFGIEDSATATRLSFLSVAIWWLLFSIPLFRRVSEPRRRLMAGEGAGQNPLRAAFSRLRVTVRDLRGYRQAFLMLVAFLIYNDGIGTIIRMATAYGTEIGIGQGSLIGALLMVQFVGIPFSFLFGGLASRIGAKHSVLVALVVYSCVAVLGYFMQNATHFFALAFLVGMVQGGSQALSRSLFASLIPAHKSSEFFGFFAVFEKVAGILGPAVFAGAIAATGSSRNAILALIAFFAVGGLLLSRVDVEEGQLTARRAEAQALASPAEDRG